MERRVDRSLPLANLGEDIVSIISQSWRRLKKGEFLWIEKKKRKEAIRGRIAQVTCWWILSYLLGWLTIWSGGLGTFYRERANPRSVWALAPSARLASPRAPSVHPLHPIRLDCRPTDRLTQRVSLLSLIMFWMVWKTAGVWERVSECPCFRIVEFFRRRSNNVWCVCVIRRFHWGKKKKQQDYICMNMCLYICM